MEITSLFNIGDTVHFMENNKVVSSKITCINFPSVFKRNGKIEYTSITYKVERNTELQQNNSRGIPSCWLFPTKKSLLKSL